MLKQGDKVYWVYVCVNSFGYPVRIPAAVVKPGAERTQIEFKKQGGKGFLTQKVVKNFELKKRK